MRFGARSHRAVLARYPDVREPELHKLIIRDIIDRAGARRDYDQRGSDRRMPASRAQTTCGGKPAPLIRYSDDWPKRTGSSGDSYIKMSITIRASRR